MLREVAIVCCCTLEEVRLQTVARSFQSGGWWSKCTSLLDEALICSTSFSVAMKFSRKLLPVCSASLFSCFSCSSQLQLSVFLPMGKLSMTSVCQVRCTFSYLFLGVCYKCGKCCGNLRLKIKIISSLTLHKVKLEGPECRQYFLGLLCFLFALAGIWPYRGYVGFSVV